MSSDSAIKIIKYFIKSSPVGEVKDVLDDLAIISGNSSLLQREELQLALREYFEAHGQHFFVDERAVLVNALGRQEAGEGEESEEPKPFVYFDPVQKVRFSVDPITSHAKIEENIQEESSALV